MYLVYYVRLVVDLTLAAVILAGGRGRRFGGNKLLARLPGGGTVIDGVVKALMSSTLVEEAFLAVRTGSMGRVLSARLNIPYIVDEFRGEGPHVAMLTALNSLEYDEFLFVPGDLPFIKAETLDRLVDEARVQGASCASPLWGNGVIEVLLVYYRRSGREEVLRDAFKFKGLRPSDIHRFSPRTLLVGVSNLTQDPQELSNINRPEDLLNPRVRGVPTSRLLLLREHSKYYEEAVKMLREGMFAGASDKFAMEGKLYYSAAAYHLAYHAYLDCARLNYNYYSECLEGASASKRAMGIGAFHE